MLKQMRSKAVVAAALSLMLLMSACGTTPTNNKDTDSTPTSAVTTQAPVEEGTRIVSTVLGDVAVPVNPQKIVGIQCFNILKSLNANTIDMTGLENLTYFSDNYNWEELMALEPDLIITSYYEGAEEYIDRCKQIAPTVTFNDTATVVEKQQFIGEVTGKQDVAKEKITAYEDTLKNSIEALVDAEIYGSSIAIVQYTSSGVMYAYGDKFGRGGDILFHSLGFQPTKIVRDEIMEGDELYLQLSMETLPEYADADYIIVMHPENETNDLYENGVWKSLKAVKEGKCFEISAEEYLKYLNMPSVVENEAAVQLYTARFLGVTQ